MKNFYITVCLIVTLAVICCFAGCYAGSFDDVYVEPASDTDTEEATTANKVATTDIPDTPIVGSTDKIVTNYTRCRIVNVDGAGKTIVGEVVSWVLVSENLIQVTVTNARVLGEGTPWNSSSKTSTFLVSPDRLVFSD